MATSDADLARVLQEQFDLQGVQPEPEPFGAAPPAAGGNDDDLARAIQDGTMDELHAQGMPMGRGRAALYGPGPFFPRPIYERTHHSAEPLGVAPPPAVPDLLGGTDAVAETGIL